MTPDELTRLRRQLADRTAAIMAGQFRGLESYHESDVARFAAQAQPVLQGAQMALGQMVAQQMRDEASDVLGRQLAPLVIPADTFTDLRQGVSTADELRRPFVQVWAELNRSGDLGAGIDRGALRVAEIAEMDLQQTYSVAADAALGALDDELGDEGLPEPPPEDPDDAGRIWRYQPEERKVRYWRRELVGDRNCLLCILTSTRRYKRGDLNPIHPGCDCRVRVIYVGEWDQIRERDVALIKQANAVARDLRGMEEYQNRKTGKFDYRRAVTNITAEHSEHPAPLLVMPNQKFTRYRQARERAEATTGTGVDTDRNGPEETE